MCRWHDAATFDSHFRTGGSNGSIRNHDVYNRESNKGLKIAIDYCGNNASLFRSNSNLIARVYYLFVICFNVYF